MTQGCISCGILLSGIWARGVSSEHMENMDMFSCSLTFCALIIRELNQIFIACLFKGSKKQSSFLQTLLFMAFLVTVLKNLTYALVSTWSLVSSEWEHIRRKMHPCLEEVQADRQTKDPSGHRRSDFWEVSTSSIVNRREPGGILLKNSQIWNNLFGIKIKTSSWVFCCGNSYSSR